MKKPLLTVLVALATALASGAALADRDRHDRHHHHHRGGHAHFGVFVGAPWYAPIYAPPVYVPPRVVVVPVPQPPVYIEQAPIYDNGAAWYYCQPANAYYPQVTECPGAWIRVPARP